MEDGASFDRDAAERVMRRAIELVDDGTDDTGTISDRAMFEAAVELGIDPSEMQRAMAEERMGLLTDTSHPRSDRLVGPDRVDATRLVDGDVDTVLDLTDQWLRRGHSFRRVRRNAGWAEYRRRSDPAASVERAARSFSGHRELAHVRRIRVLGVPAGSDRTLVALVVDVSTSRTAATATGVAVGAASGTAMSGAATVAAGVPWVWVGIPVAAAAGIGVMAARKAYVGGIDEELEAILDLVATGVPPTSKVSMFAERLMGARGDWMRQVRSRP